MLGRIGDLDTGCSKAYLRVRRPAVFAHPEAPVEYLLEPIPVVGADLAADESQHVVVSPGIVIRWSPFIYYLAIKAL